MGSFLEAFLQSKLTSASTKGILRSLKTRANSLEDFASNDYLGLAQSPELFNSISKRLTELSLYNNGSTGSRLLTGNSEYTQLVEQRLADIFQSESALIFNSGYTANLAVFSALPQKGDTVFYDELSHASIKDGLRLSLASRFSFRHNDYDDLEKKLIRVTSGKIFIVVESIYSMDGDECNLETLVELAEKFFAVVILDEAHSTGVFGLRGEGLAITKQLQAKIPVRIYTFGKAMGVHGACVAGSNYLSQYLVNFARPFIYTTALSPHNIAAIECAFDFLEQHNSTQQNLHAKIKLFLDHLTIAGRTDSTSAIQTAIIPGNENVRIVASELSKIGFDVRPILSPTVPQGKERLRICLHAYNSDEKIISLAQSLNHIEGNV